MMNKSDSPKPWSVPLAAQDVPPEGRHLTLAADEPTCAAIAKLAGALSIARIEADFDAFRWRGDGLRLSGEVTAVVTQNCVVTLEPIESEIAEPIELTFLPPAAHAAPAATAASATVPVEGEDPPEPLVNGTVDLGVIAMEFLLLGIHPYPRKPGAVFAPPAEPEPGNPFAVLATLKKDFGEG